MIKKLIKQFYKKEYSKEKKKTIINDFIKGSKDIDDFFSEEEWNDFVYRESLHADVSKRMKKIVFKHTQTKVRVINIVKRLSVAAAIFLVAGTGWKYFIGTNSSKYKIDGQSKMVVVDTVNASNASVNIVLPDGSIVKLMPNSNLKYQKPFGIDKRIISLFGEATFKIAKDSTKPFTVYSGEIATTALGTVFKVTSLKENANIKVRLYEGKVVIKSSDSAKKFINNYYLSPGEEFYYNRKTLSAGIIKYNKRVEGLTKRKSINDSAVTDIDNWYMFNNQNLPQVFESLKTIYNVKIEFNENLVSRMNFIGRIDSNDSIDAILKDIAFLNGLTVTKKGNTYFIEKK